MVSCDSRCPAHSLDNMLPHKIDKEDSAIRTCRDCGLFRQKASKPQSTPKSKCSRSAWEQSEPGLGLLHCYMLPVGAGRCWYVLVAICCMNSQHVEKVTRYEAKNIRKQDSSIQPATQCRSSFKQILRDVFC